METNRLEVGHSLTGAARVNAFRLAELHPLIGDWIAAAPVLALVQPSIPNDAFLLDMAHKGARLKEVFRGLGIPNAVRALTIKRTLGSVQDFYRFFTLTYFRPSSADLMAGKMTWSEIAAAGSRASALFPACARDAFCWAVKHGVSDLAIFEFGRDYFASHGVDWTMTPQQVFNAHEKWIRDLARQKVMGEATKPENLVEVDLEGAPDSIVIDGVICTALKTPGALIIEGAEMRHCVGGADFRLRLIAGTSRFYHLESEHGTSTVEFGEPNGFMADPKPATIRQHKAYYNGEPVKAHKVAARKLSEIVKVKAAKPETFFSGTGITAAEFARTAYSASLAVRGINAPLIEQTNGREIVIVVSERQHVVPARPGLVTGIEEFVIAMGVVSEVRVEHENGCSPTVTVVIGGTSVTDLRPDVARVLEEAARMRETVKLVERVHVIQTAQYAHGINAACFIDDHLLPRPLGATVNINPPARHSLDADRVNDLAQEIARSMSVRATLRARDAI